MECRFIYIDKQWDKMVFGLHTNMNANDNKQHRKINNYEYINAIL